MITWPQYEECPMHRKETAYEIRGEDQMVQIMQECHALSVHTPKITQTDAYNFFSVKYEQNDEMLINCLFYLFGCSERILLRNILDIVYYGVIMQNLKQFEIHG